MRIQAAGGECVEDVRVLARDGGLTRLLHRPLPSPDALHDFLGTFHDEPQMGQRPGAGAWIPAENAALQALGLLNTALIQRAVAGVPAPTATLDLDATTIVSHQRDALPLYTGAGGTNRPPSAGPSRIWSSPTRSRDGNVPAGMDPLGVARRGFAALPSTVTHRAFRGDSACYQDALLEALARAHRRHHLRRSDPSVAPRLAQARPIVRPGAKAPRRGEQPLGAGGTGPRPLALGYSWHHRVRPRRHEERPGGGRPAERKVRGERRLGPG